MDDGVLIDPKNIDWANKKLKLSVSGTYIHSLPMNPDLPYKRIQVKNGLSQSNVSLSLDSFYFINGKKIPSERITKDRNGNVIISNVTGEVLVFDHHDNLYTSCKFDVGSTDVVYITPYNETTKTIKELSTIKGSEFVVKTNGVAERLSKLKFTDIITNSSGYSIRLQAIHGNDGITSMESNYPIREDYLLVFVDGLFTTNYRYRSDGTIFLDTPAKEYVEVYVLVPNSINCMDVCRVDNEKQFTFSNIRVNTVGYNSSINSLTRTNMLLSRSDIMFLKRLLDRTYTLEQKLSHLSKYSINVSRPDANVMMHYTMDRMLYDGTKGRNFMQDNYIDIVYDLVTGSRILHIKIHSIIPILCQFQRMKNLLEMNFWMKNLMYQYKVRFLGVILSTLMKSSQSITPKAD